MLRTFLLAAVLLAFAACADPRRRTEDLLVTVGAERLRRDAAVLYKNAFARPSPGFAEIKPSDYPSSFRRFAPRHVGAYPDGVTIAVQKDGAVETGLYIVPHSMERTPTPTPRATFERLADGVYWYAFKD